MGCGSSAAKNAVAVLPPEEQDHIDNDHTTDKVLNGANNSVDSAANCNGKPETIEMPTGDPITVPVISDQQVETVPISQESDVLKNGNVKVDLALIGATINGPSIIANTGKPLVAAFDECNGKKLDEPDLQVVSTVVAPLSPPLPSHVQKPISQHNSPPMEDWIVADQVADNCPTSTTQTLQHLTDYLKGGLTGTRLARAIFRWITRNITWEKGGSQQSDSVLSRGVADDEGFAALFAAMCHQCHINTHMVKGHVKTPDYLPGSRPDPGTDEQWWNVLILETGTYTVDCCRGAGLVRDGTFQPLFNDFYWLPLPSEILYTHYTDNPEYQGCTTFYSLEEWIMLPKTFHLYHQYNCEITGHLKGSFQADSESLLHTNFTLPCHVICTAQIERLNPKQKLPPSYSYVYRDEEICTIYSGYPYPGIYLLRLLGQTRDALNEGMEKIVELSVTVSKGRGTDTLYPVIMNHSKEFLLVGPLMGQLIRHMAAYFHCNVKGASQVSVLVGENVFPLKKISDDRDILIRSKNSERRLNRGKDNETVTVTVNKSPNKTADSSETTAVASESALTQAASAIAIAALMAASKEETAPTAPDSPADYYTTICVTPASPPCDSVPDSHVTTVWAGEALVSSREVFLAAFFTENIEYTKLVRFHSKLI